jgi:hypothetical protein
VQLSVRIPATTRARVVSRAVADRRSEADVIRALVERGIDDPAGLEDVLAALAVAPLDRADEAELARLVLSDPEQRVAAIATAWCRGDAARQALRAIVERRRVETAPAPTPTPPTPPAGE